MLRTGARVFTATGFPAQLPPKKPFWAPVKGRCEEAALRVVATIEARMRSTRFPRKVLKPILGRPMLALMIERLRRVRQLEDIVIATTVDTSCDAIEDLARDVGIGCYRGSEDDVLDRVLQAARQAQADIIVETTGDCPLIDPGVTDRVIEVFLSSNADYCSNILERTFPLGMDVQVFPTSVLEEVSGLTADPVDHEHVSLYIYSHPERFRLLNVRSELTPSDAELRLTVDTPEDFALVTHIYQKLYPTRPDFDLADILELLSREPQLREINSHVQQKAPR